MRAALLQIDVTMW